MLYLIRSFLRSGKSILKVGYTYDVTSRMDNYYHSNPGFELISIRQGSDVDEKRLQLYLESFGYKYHKLKEWFYDCPEVLSLFHACNSKINKKIWSKREDLFDLGKNSDIRYREIYKNLKQTYKTSCHNKIDQEWRRQENKNVLNKMRTIDYYMGFGL